MSLKKIKWSQLETENIENGDDVVLGSEAKKLKNIHTKDIIVSGVTFTDLIDLNIDMDNSINDHESRISGNTIDITDHESRISGNTMDITDHESRISVVESGDTHDTATLESDNSDILDLNGQEFIFNSSNIILSGDTITKLNYVPEYNITTLNKSGTVNLDWTYTTSENWLLNGAATITYGLIKNYTIRRFITGDFSLTLPPNSVVFGTYDGTKANLIQFTPNVLNGEVWVNILN